MATRINLHVIFITRKHDPEALEAVEAWDEYSIDANYEGWEEARQKALDSIGSDLDSHAEVVVKLDYNEVFEAVRPKARVLDGKIVQAD